MSLTSEYTEYDHIDPADAGAGPAAPEARYEDGGRPASRFSRFLDPAGAPAAAATRAATRAAPGADTRAAAAAAPGADTRAAAGAATDADMDAGMDGGMDAGMDADAGYGYLPTTVRARGALLRRFPAGSGALPSEVVERAVQILGDIKVDGADPLVPTLAALAQRLQAEGLPMDVPADAGGDWPEHWRRRLDDVLSAACWMGPLAELLQVPGVANLQINGVLAPVIVEYTNGARDTMRSITMTREWAEYLVDRWLQYRGVQLDERTRAEQIVHGTLNRMRFAYFGPRHATQGYTLQVRMPLASATLDNLVDEKKLMTPEAAEWLRAMIRARVNILVSGQTNAGKTTLVNALLGEVDPDERVAVLEAFAELNLAGRPGTVGYEIGTGGDDEHGMADLLKAQLYNSATRLVLGEARGAEAAQLIMAMTSGTQGCIATIHAESAEEAAPRLAHCARQSPALATLNTGELYRTIADLQLLCVHVQLIPDEAGRRAKRRVSAILQVFDAVPQTQVFKTYHYFRTDERTGELLRTDEGLPEKVWARMQHYGVSLPMRGPALDTRQAPGGRAPGGRLGRR